MKGTGAFLFLLVAFSINAFAQSLSDELEKIKQIEMLESTRRDVNVILRGYKGKYDAVGLSEVFSSKKFKIEVSYTRGDCPKGVDQWKVEKGKVDSIIITVNDPVKFEELKYDLSGFLKEEMPSIVTDTKDVFVYHNKNKGIVFFVEKEKLTSIFLIPSRNRASQLCESEQSRKLREQYSRESYFDVLEPPQK